jgi:hypothetical protein
MKRLWKLLAAVAVYAALPTESVAQQVIGSADATFEIEKSEEGAGGGKAVKPGEADGSQPPGKQAPDQPTQWKVKEVKVIRVINRDGNNPLMPEEPVFNEDGQVVADQDEGGAGGGCTGKRVPYGLPDGPPDYGVVTILYDPDTGFCNLISGYNKENRAINVYMWPEDSRGQGPGRGDGPKPWVSIANATMDSIWDGSDFLTGVTPGQIIAFTAEHNPTGHVYRFTIKVDVVIAGGVTLVEIKRIGRR